MHCLKCREVSDMVHVCVKVKQKGTGDPTKVCGSRSPQLNQTQVHFNSDSFGLLLRKNTRAPPSPLHRLRRSSFFLRVFLSVFLLAFFFLYRPLSKRCRTCPRPHFGVALRRERKKRARSDSFPLSLTERSSFLNLF